MTFAMTQTDAKPAGAGASPALLGWAGLTLVYALVFSLTGSGPVHAIGQAVSNVAPAAALGWIATRALAAWRPANLSRRALLHLLVGAGFVGAWYGLLIPSLAIVTWLAGQGFHPRPLTGPALPWQLFQGLMIYAVVAVVCERREPAPQAQIEIGRSNLRRYLVRRGEEMRPVSTDQIVCIRGADDYSEVETSEGVHLARMTLQGFEAELDPDRFIRVHRSCIINFDRLEKTEPAGGGRLLAHMDTGLVVPVSRDGARRLRNRLV